ncbi:MAG: TetR/AcrR family transcriptional regulator [Solirubrobacteraceae bacterium]|nr:TetR/AcrR family transcriptional regulator [Solirubrobacteraceae bacterium]
MTTQGQPTSDYRQRLIDALAVVVARDGYGGAKIQDVVREAKVSLRTFYAEFPNKEECFLALYEQVTTFLLERLRRSITFEGPWREEMEKGFVAHFEILQSVPRVTYAMVVELATLSDNARRIRQSATDRLVDVICEQVEEGRRRYPEIPSRAVSPMMARALMGGVFEMTVDVVIREEWHRLPELIEVSTDLMWSVVTNVESPAGLDARATANTPNSGVIDPEAPVEAGVRR